MVRVAQQVEALDGRLAMAKADDQGMSCNPTGEQGMAFRLNADARFEPDGMAPSGALDVSLWAWDGRPRSEGARPTPVASRSRFGSFHANARKANRTVIGTSCNAVPPAMNRRPRRAPREDASKF